MKIRDCGAMRASFAAAKMPIHGSFNCAPVNGKHLPEVVMRGKHVMQEQEAQLALQRKRRQQSEARQNQGPPKKLKQGDPGFRWHATIPSPAKLDYMRRPDNLVPAGEGEAVKGKAKPKDRMSKKLAAMSRKGGHKGAADGKVSLQGRGLLL